MWFENIQLIEIQVKNNIDTLTGLNAVYECDKSDLLGEEGDINFSVSQPFFVRGTLTYSIAYIWRHQIGKKGSIGKKIEEL